MAMNTHKKLTNKLIAAAFGLLVIYEVAPILNAIAHLIMVVHTK